MKKAEIVDNHIYHIQPWTVEYITLHVSYYKISMFRKSNMIALLHWKILYLQGNALRGSTIPTVFQGLYLF